MLLYEEILYRVLQFSTAAGSVALLITCMRMSGVKWWLPVPIYLLAISLIVTFMTTFFMRQYTFPMTIWNIFLLAISSGATAAHRLMSPLPTGTKQASTRRLLTVLLPVLFVLIGVWCIGVAFEGGSDYFKQMRGLIVQVIRTQQRQDLTLEELREGGIYRQAQIDLLKAEMKRQAEHDRQKARRDSITAARLLNNQSNAIRDIKGIKARQKAAVDAERFKLIPPKKPWRKIGQVNTGDTNPTYITRRY